MEQNKVKSLAPLPGFIAFSDNILTFPNEPVAG